MAARFLQMHPTLDVRLMTQETPLHDVLNALATWGGLWNERTLAPALAVVERLGWHGFAAQWAQIVLNQYNLIELKRARRAQRRAPAGNNT